MVPFFLSILSAYSISIAAIVGLVRIRKIHQSYRPFIYICILALLNEVISMVFVYLFRNNNYNYNIYAIVEAMLYLWLFKGWGHFSNKKRSYLFTIILLIGVWITDNLIWHSLGSSNSL